MPSPAPIPLTSGPEQALAACGLALFAHNYARFENPFEWGQRYQLTGAHYRSSIVFVQPAPGGLKIVFENYTLPRVESEVFQPSPDGHFVEIEMASFHPDAYGVEATGDVVVRLDGREMMRTRQVAYPFPWGHECIGSNPFGTTCALEFRGWIVDARWVRGLQPRPLLVQPPPLFP